MAILSKSDYINYINSILPDNSTQQISPQDLRLSLTNLADSVGEFLSGVNIQTHNFSTPEVRTTRAGELSLDKLGLVGRSSEDNSAFGYYALGGNYNGKRNTAIGSSSIGCNLYGSHNTAVGFNSLAGNITGSGNIGIGNHTLQLNKNGDFNIAIGHAAGYYIGQDDSYKFYVASHAIDSESLCDAVSGSGADPLLHGDLKNIKLGIGTKTLDNFGTLQVSGSVTPTQTSLFNLGHGSRNWSSLYLSSGIGYTNSKDFYLSVISPKGQAYPDQYNQQTVAVFTSGGNIGFGTTTPSGDQGLITVGGNIVPSVDGQYRLGTDKLKWDGYFNDVVVSGRFYCNDINISQVNLCAYDCKTLHLASSGICGDDIIGDSFCGFLTDEQLDGAGFEVHSSGNDYKRDYKFIFYSSDPSIKCLEQDSVYSRSSWFSNISLHIESGKHLQADRIISNNGNVSIVSQSGCYGLFIKEKQPSGNIVYLGSENHIGRGYKYETDVNLIGQSGNNNFIVSYSSPSSGVNVAQRFATRVSGDMRGFGFEYHDDKSTSDRLSTHIYNGQTTTLEAVTVLRNYHPQSGLFGITNILHSGTPILPSTIFNIQSSDIVEARFSSAANNKKVKLQLLGNGNVKSSGFQATYNVSYDTNQGSGTNQTVVDFDLIRASDIESGVMSFTEKGFVGIGNHHINETYTWNATDPLTIRHNATNSGTIALKEQSSAPTATADFGKIYVKPDTTGGNTQSIYFLDDNGNEVKITRSMLNYFDGLLYGDSKGNTYGGYYAANNRPTTSCSNNTAIGYNALNSVSTGGRNIAIGSGSLQSLTVGSNNVVIGDSLKQSLASSGNIVLGVNNLNYSSNPINCIAIGSGLYNNSSAPNNTLVIGFGDSPLINGSMGSSNRELNVSNAKLSISSQGNNQEIVLHTDLVDSKYQSYLDILQNQITSNTFTGQFNVAFVNTYDQHYKILTLDHSSIPMSNTANYAGSGRPYAELKGDLRLQGSIRFSDGTSVDSASDITLTGGSGISIDNGFVDINLENLQDVESAFPSLLNVNTSYLPISVKNGAHDVISKINLASLSDRLQSGIPAIGDNCNAIFTNAENNINRANNKNTVFIGCDVGVSATGWKHSVMIGTEAGYGADTPNPSLAIDTASVFIGYRTGRDADNVENCVFVGQCAGQGAVGANHSVFLGNTAGYKSGFNNSIGIGKFALSSSGTFQTGSNNIEIVAGLLNSERLLYGSGNYSNKLNIQNSIAGDTNLRRISIGDVVVTPDAPLSVRKNNTIVGHSTASYIQTWYCNNNLVAAINCDGDYVRKEGLPTTVEGYMSQGVNAPASGSSPTSGILVTRDENWSTGSSVYVVNRDVSLNIHNGAYVIAQRINGTYRPIWISCSGT